MSAVDNNMSTCAACGKDGDGLKACTACKLVKYCNVTCQKAHRPNHKKVCKKRAAEIFHEALFKTPPPNEDCPICYLRLPLNLIETKYQPCCGKIICCGCINADIITRESADWSCPFCRDPSSTALAVDAIIERLNKRVEVGDVNAMCNLGSQYFRGDGVPQDSNKALELWHRAAKLGCGQAHSGIGVIYFNGEVVEKDVKKATYHLEQGAMRGHVAARYNIGIIEMNAPNMNRAMKHFMISAEVGHDDSLKEIKKGFSHGHVTKDDFEKALRAHKESTDEMQSDQRDAARHILQSQSP
ncbi:hypothetical protein ACHAXR_004996 [Thalassiosira sp. AJA248-18]